MNNRSLSRSAADIRVDFILLQILQPTPTDGSPHWESLRQATWNRTDILITAWTDEHNLEILNLEGAGLNTCVLRLS